MNEALFREVNERIDQLQDELGRRASFEIVVRVRRRSAASSAFTITH